MIGEVVIAPTDRLALGGGHDASAWADAVAAEMCRQAEARGIIGSKWRDAWWMSGDHTQQLQIITMFIDRTEALRWIDTDTGGSVWLYLGPNNAYTRVHSIHDDKVDVAPDTLLMPLKNVGALARSDDAEGWVRWWPVRCQLAGEPLVERPADTEGDLAIYEVADGSVVLGEVRAVRGKKAVAIECEGVVLQIPTLGAGRMVGPRWVEAADSLIAEGRARYKTINSAQQTLTHRRNRLEDEGRIGPWVERVLPD
jgi:hypothetical protein